MKKILTLFVMATVVAAAALAVPAKRGFQNVKQADGTSISVEMRGDEWHHSLVTTDGHAVSLEADGNCYYRTATAVSEVVAHNPAERSAAEQAFIDNELSAQDTEQQATTARKARKATAARKATQVPNNGTPRIPVILVQYTDKKMTATADQIKTNFTDLANQYFTDQSNGKFSPQFDVFGIYTLSSTRATYGGNDSSGDDKGVGLMVGEAVDLATAEGQINWSNYDNDGDGEADVVIVLYAGVGEAQASTTVPNAVWPMQWSLSSANYYGDGTGTRTQNGVTIDKFAVFNEINGSSDSGTTLDGVGTFCHEFSHCLGLPDFYETTYSNGYFGMGSWSLLDYGCYNNDGYTPIGYSAYEKYFMGWIDLVTPVRNTRYTLPVFNQKNASTDVALQLTSDINSNEYYLLEYRKKQGWDAYIPDEGVMITHVSYIASRWEANTVNNYSVQLMTIAPADNKLSSSTESSDLWGDSKYDFTDDTSPAAKLYLNASGSATGSAGYLGKPVTDITLYTDSATLWYDFSIEAPVLTDSSDVDLTEFTAHWTPVDGATSYTLQISDPSKKSATELVFDEDFSGGTTTWTTSTTYTDVSGYLRLGSSKSVGSITSPTFSAQGYGNKVTVMVTGKSYNNDGSVPMEISLTSGSTEVSSTTSTLESDESTQTYVLDVADDTQTLAVKIAGTTKKKRLLISNVKVYAGDASSQDAPLKAVTETGDSVTRTITGITDTLYHVTSLSAGGTYVYKVKAVGDWGETAWSQSKTITLAGSGSSLFGDVNRDGKVDVTDVTALVNMVLDDTIADYTVADLNSDGTLDASDVTILVGIITAQ